MYSFARWAVLFYLFISFFMKFNNQSNSSCLCFVILYTQLCGECAVRMEWAVSCVPDIEIQMWNINKVYFKKKRAIEATLVNVRERVKGVSGKTGISNAKCDTLSITTTTTSTVIDAHISYDQSEMFLSSSLCSLSRALSAWVLFSSVKQIRVLWWRWNYTLNSTVRLFCRWQQRPIY